MLLLKKGSQGDEVKKLQKILMLPVDGIFGSQTQNAVKKFQLQNDIKVDGIVGNVTWQLLLIVKPDIDAIDEDTDLGEQWFTTNFDLLQEYHLLFLYQHRS